MSNTHVFTTRDFFDAKLKAGPSSYLPHELNAKIATIEIIKSFS